MQMLICAVIRVWCHGEQLVELRSNSCQIVFTRLYAKRSYIRVFTLYNFPVTYFFVKKNHVGK